MYEVSCRMVAFEGWASLKSRPGDWAGVRAAVAEAPPCHRVRVSRSGRVVYEGAPAALPGAEPAADLAPGAPAPAAMSAAQAAIVLAAVDAVMRKYPHGQRHMPYLRDRALADLVGRGAMRVSHKQDYDVSVAFDGGRPTALVAHASDGSSAPVFTRELNAAIAAEVARAAEGAGS